MMFMATIKNVGAPTKRTKGGIGDIYIDKATGRKYKCTGSYGSAAHEAEYYWRALKDKEQVVENNVIPDPVQPQVSNDDIVDPEVTDIVDGTNAVSDNEEGIADPEVTSSGDDGEPEPETNKETNKSNGGRRTNYSAAYNKNK